MSFSRLQQITPLEHCRRHFQCNPVQLQRNEYGHALPVWLQEFSEIN